MNFHIWVTFNKSSRPTFCLSPPLFVLCSMHIFFLQIKRFKFQHDRKQKRKSPWATPQVIHDHHTDASSFRTDVRLKPNGQRIL